MSGLEKIAFSWSGGKDSALALHRILNSGEFQVCYLLTVVNRTHKRISMHGIREELLDAQVAAIGLPMVKVYVEEGTNEEYERKMEETLLKFRSEGIKRIVFGDIFLEDLREYRDNNMAKVEMTGYYPLWKEDTRNLINEFILNGYRTITCCINDGYLTEEHVGVEIDEPFLEQLPEDVDPCGENGEFHSFVFDGPIFNKALQVVVGEKVYKPLDLDLPVPDNHPPIDPSPTKGFWYADVVLQS